MTQRGSVNVYLSTQGGDTARAELRQFGATGAAAARAMQTAMRDASAGFERDSARVVEGAGRQRVALQQVGFQVQDFFVQVQGGTPVITALVQQGSQMAGAFGPAGVAIGAVGTVLGVALGAMLNWNREAETARAATDALETATKGLQGTIAGTASSIDDLARKYSVLSEEMRTIERLKLGAKLREDEAALAAIRDRVAASVRQATESGQLDFLRQSEALARLDPGAERGQGVVQLQRFLEGLDQALERSAKGGLTEFADEVDRLVTSLPEAGSDARKLADSFIAPADGAISLAASVRQARRALDELAGRERAKGADDPFLDKARAAEQAEKAIAKVERASARVAQQDDRRQQALAIEIQNMQRLVVAGDQGAAAYERERVAIEAETKARQAGLDPKGEEARLYEDLTVRLDQQAEARKRNARATEEQAKAVEDFYRRAGDQIDRVLDSSAQQAGQDEKRELENLQRQLQGNVASALERGFEDGFGSVDDLVEQFGDLLKSTVATALADQLITESLAGSIQGALGTQLGDLFPGLAGTGAGQATVGQAGAGALGAAFVGYAVGQQFQGDRRLGVLGGAASGAATGAVIGSAFPGYGTVIGAGAGAVIGGIAGYFGSGQGGGEHNDNYQGGYDPVTGRRVAFQNTRPGAQNQGAVQAVLQELEALRSGGRALGLGFAAQELTVQSGNRTGLTLNGERFDDVQQLGVAALRQLLSGATGLSTSQATALQNTTGDTAAEILSDLDLARQLDDLARGGGALGAQLRENERQFDALRVRAEDLGLATDALDKAQGEGLAAIRQSVEAQLGIVGPLEAQLRQLDQAFEEANDNRVELGLSQAELDRAQQQSVTAIRQSVEAQLGLVSPLTVAIREIRDRFGEAIANADRLGLSEEKLIEARDRAIRQAREAFEEQRRAALEQERTGVLGEASRQADIVRAGFAQRLDQIGTRRGEIGAALDPLEALREDLTAGALGGATATQRLAETQRLYEQAVRDARTGGTSAEEAQRVVQFGGQVVDLGREVYASGPQSAAFVRDVLSTVNQITGGLEREDRQLDLAQRSLEVQQRAFEQRLPEEIRRAGEVTASEVRQATVRLDRQLVLLDRLERRLQDVEGAIQRQRVA